MSRRPDPFSFPLLRIDAVAHVGTLDPSRRGVANRSSLEAFCLSVSTDPDAWRGIARCGDAPAWTLSRPGATWFDACALPDAQEAEITDWAVGAGLAERRTLWRSWRFDDESNDWAYVNLPGLNPGASLPGAAALSPRPRLKFFVTWSTRRPEPPV